MMMMMRLAGPSRTSNELEMADRGARFPFLGGVGLARGVDSTSCASVSRALCFLALVVAVGSDTAGGAPIPLQSRETVSGTVSPSGYVCYTYTADTNITRKFVFWSEAMLYIRLDPCSGLPHMQVSVYGCPSKGNPIVWEYQSDWSRKQLKSQGQTVPEPWEWPGDTETLSMNMTHRTWYIEVSQYHTKIDTNATLWDLEQSLRAAGFQTAADRVLEISRGAFGRSESLEIRRFQELLMADANFQLTLTLHDNAKVPKDKIFAMTNVLNWVRDIQKRPELTKGLAFSDDPQAYVYSIAFWPPSIAANNISRVDSIAMQNFTGQLRRLLESREENNVQKWERELEETERKLEALSGLGVVGGFDTAVEEGSREWAQEWERRRQGRRKGMMSLEQVASMPLIEADLEYIVYWRDITEQFKKRWGVIFDKDGKNLTRPIDNTCGVRIESCGVLQWITKLEFQKLDRDNNTVLDRSEYQERYTIESQFEGNTGFSSLFTFSKLAENVTAKNGYFFGLTQATWEEQYIGSDAILRSSIKDALVRTFWTACGMKRFGNPLAIGGDIDEKVAVPTWTSKAAFDQFEDGRLIRSFKSLKDDNNNVYIVNVIVRHKLTGEEVAYKTHVVQRLTPLYKIPPVSGPEIGLVVGVSIVSVVVVAVIVVVLVLTRSKKMRPRLKVSKYRVNEKKRGKQ